MSPSYWIKLYTNISPNQTATLDSVEKIFYLRLQLCLVSQKAVIIATVQSMPRWRNGRRDRLKICWPQGHVGSSPSRGTG